MAELAAIPGCGGDCRQIEWCDGSGAVFRDKRQVVINYYFKGKVPNFGDDLNAWLWPKLIPEVLDDDESRAMLLGIGSILFDTFSPTLQKIVLGTIGPQAPLTTAQYSYFV